MSVSLNYDWVEDMRRSKNDNQDIFHAFIGNSGERVDLSSGRNLRKNKKMKGVLTLSES